MREIVSPLMGLRSPFGGRIDAYKAGGFRPPFVADFSTGYYRTDSARTTFADSITHARAGNATMTDSDGVLKWAPHNLLTYSEDISAIPWTTTNVTINSATNFTFDTDGGYISTSITVDTPAKYTLKATISGSAPGDTFILELVDNADGSDQNYTTVTVGEDPTEHTVVADMTTGTFSGALLISINRTALDRSITAGSDVTITNIHLYRSDLGGMVDNPDRGDSYVPTTSAAVYLPRRGHHVWNGSAWVDEGILHESEARTNLVTYSQDFTDASWGKLSANNGTTPVVTADYATSPDGRQNASRVQMSISSDGGSDDYSLLQFDGGVQTGDCSASLWVKSNTGSEQQIYYRVNTGRVKTVTTEWTRIDDTDTLSTQNAYIGFGVRNNQGSETVDILIYGAQLEAGSTPSSYIPTAGSTATRAAETLTIPAANLPWPSPVVIGEELVTNGTFDTDSDWTKGTGWTISGGVASSDGSQAARSSLYQNCLEVGRLCQFSMTVSNYVSGNVRLRNGIGAVETYIADKSANGTVTGVYLVGSSGGNTTLVVDADADFVGSIDNISVREIDPLAVSIAMEGRMTYADEGSVDVRFIQWQLNADNRIIIQEVNTGGDIQFVQEADNVFTSVASSNSTPPGVLVPFNIASRHGSTFINGAVDGTALTADTTPTALPDLSATDLSLGDDLMGTIKTFRVWDKDIGDTGIAGAST